MKTPEQLVEYVRQHPGITPNQVTSNLKRHGVRYADANTAIKKACGMPLPGTAATAGKVIGKSVSHLFDEFDELSKVRTVMKGLSKSGYLEDDEMRTMANVPLRSWNMVKTHKALASFRYKLPNQKFVWMHPSAQAELTAAINLSQT